MIKKYNDFINEGLLPGKPKEDVINFYKNKEQLAGKEFKEFISYGLDFDDLHKNKDGYIVIYNSLHINLEYIKNFKKLPNNLLIKKDLFIVGKLKILPNNLKIIGDLECPDCDLTELPTDLMVGNNLYIESNNITNIPDTIEVGNKIYIKNNPIDYDKLPKKFNYYK